MQYISSNDNRFYAALEAIPGVQAVPSAASRLLASRVRTTQRVQRSKRQDKSGFRSLALATPCSVRQSDFQVESRLTKWDGANPPNLGPLVQAAFGSAGKIITDLLVQAATPDGQVQTTTAHDLSVGDGLSYAGELRFVAAVLDAEQVQLNLPFSNMPQAGQPFARTVTYRLATDVPSLSIFDYWTPAGMSRVLTGAFVNELRFGMKADGFEFVAEGIGSELIDGWSDANVPEEPVPQALDFSLVPAQTGALWLGSGPSTSQSVAEMSFSLSNNLVARPLQFGCDRLGAVLPGTREGRLSFTMYPTSTATPALIYSAASTQTAIPTMVQMGRGEGSTAALYMPNAVPDTPIYDDSQARLAWRVGMNLMRGVVQDELYLAFA